MDSSGRQQKPTASAGVPAESERIFGSKTGWVVGKDGTGRLLVDFEGNPKGPVPARLAVSLASKDIQEAITARRGVVLTFEEGDPGHPFLMALLYEPSPTPLLDAILEQEETCMPGEVGARVDGRKVVIEGRDEIVLQCGQASITLRRNGKILIRGTQVESHAKGRNRIKGASVEIN